MLKKLLVALVASVFATGAFAQAQKAEPKGQTGTATVPATPPEKSAKGEKKAKPAKKSTAKSSKAKSEDAKK
jgi:Tfp pilus assembly major pilin PilA